MIDDATIGMRVPLSPSRHHSLLLALFDLAALILAWHLTIELRIILNPLMTRQLERVLVTASAPRLSTVLAMWVVVALLLRVYRQDNGLGAPNSASVLKAVVVADTTVIVATFFSREIGGAALSRSFVLLFLPVSFVVVRCARYVAMLTALFEEKNWSSPQRLAVVGYGPRVRHLIEALCRRPGRGLRIVGIILPAGASSRGLGNPVPVLGTIRQLGEVINREKIDRILLADDASIPKYELDECALISKRMGVTISRTLNALDRQARLELGTLGNLHVLESKPIYFTRKQELIKRVFDVIISLTGLILLSPALLSFAVLIKLTSKGPVLYKSLRVGRGGRHFSFLKFRSMYVGGPSRQELMAFNEQSGHLFKIRHDPRVTQMGRFMRRFSLDELPQLANVLWGNMSLIGPRPLPAHDLDPDGQSRHFKAWAEQRSRVLPGITGLWQITGRSDVSFQEMMELDVAYIRNWSLTLDLQILLSTPRAVLSGRGAY